MGVELVVGGAIDWGLEVVFDLFVAEEESLERFRLLSLRSAVCGG